MPEIIVYGKPDCQQCRWTTRRLDKLKLPYRYFDVLGNEDARDAVAILGYQSVPVVVVGDIHWSGYREAKLQQLAEIYAAAPDIADHEAPAEAYLMDDAQWPTPENGGSRE